jgi:hypothetical protein
MAGCRSARYSAQPVTHGPSGDVGVLPTGGRDGVGKVRLCAGEPIGAKSPAHASASRQPGEMGSSKVAEHVQCAYAAPMSAPIAAPMNFPFAPNAPMGSE